MQSKLKSFFDSCSPDDRDDTSDDSSGDSESEDNGDDDNGVMNQQGEQDNIQAMTKDRYVYATRQDGSISKRNIAGQFWQAWGKRRQKLVHNYLITGWMLSPIPAVMDDAVKQHMVFHRDAVERLIKKLMAPTGNYDNKEQHMVAVGIMLNMFWTEHDQFHSKIGPYGNRDHIWHSQDIIAGNSHFWQKKNLLHYTSILGRAACIVCSKILGIGSAERSWGDVKHLKTEKRAKLSGEAVKMQGTIFGASCAERA